jgi:hypothetical protein
MANDKIQAAFNTLRLTVENDLGSIDPSSLEGEDGARLTDAINRFAEGLALLECILDGTGEEKA